MHLVPGDASDAPISRGSGAEPVWFEMWCRPCRAPGVTTGGHVVRMVRGAAPSWFGVARSVASFDLLALRRRSAREQGPEFRLVGQRARIVRDRLDHPPRPSRRERPRRPCRAFGSRDQRARRAACYSVGWGVPGASTLVRTACPAENEGAMIRQPIGHRPGAPVEATARGRPAMAAHLCALRDRAGDGRRGACRHRAAVRAAGCRGTAHG